MKKIHIAEISVAVALVISIVVSVVGFGAECENIRQDVVRLHVLANSDSPEDQNIKLIVRDTLLNSGKDIFDGAVNAANASECIASQKQELVDIVNKVLADNGFDYKAQISLGKEYFTTRVYENYTMPAGEYLALKVILGNGEGHNWWCVMFPPLCLPAASEKTDVNAFFGENGAEIIQSGAKYEIKFKIIELFEGLKNRFKTN